MVFGPWHPRHPKKHLAKNHFGSPLIKGPYLEWSPSYHRDLLCIVDLIEILLDLVECLLDLVNILLEPPKMLLGPSALAKFSEALARFILNLVKIH